MKAIREAFTWVGYPEEFTFRHACKYKGLPTQVPFMQHVDSAFSNYNTKQ